jgi:Protein of unknown function (DUF3822)
LPAENQVVNPSFNITTNTAPADKPVLLVQVGKQGISFTQLDIDSNTFIAVQVYHFEKHTTVNSIADAINDILSAGNFEQQHFKKIFVTWCFDENVLVPHEYFEGNDTAAMLNLVYGDAAQSAVQHEAVLSHSIYSVYRIPVAVKNIFNHWFPFCIQNHQGASMINLGKGNKNFLYCNFYPGSLTVLLRKNGQLQLIQNFEFNTPEDAAYHLLNVCRSFETAPEINLMVSGMIDADSSLYSELYKYFLHIEFATLPGNFNYVDAIKDQPAHYFSHLFATALCVL